MLSSRERLALKRPRVPTPAMISSPSSPEAADSPSSSAASKTSSPSSSYSCSNVSSITEKGVQSTDIPDATDTIQEELRRTSGELEAIPGKDPSHIVAYRPTYRAVLARKGYLIRNTLGSGSYSKVKCALSYQASSINLVAVKIIDRLKAPQDYQEKFMPRELKLWPHIKHPNLIALNDWFQDSRRVYMVIEYADGGDALRYVQIHGAVPESLSCKWTSQISAAVAYLHSLDIAHRDLKLENLLLDWNQNIKICDFGFVKEVVRSGGGSVVLSRTYCGSKSYAAPEILMGVPYDPKKADVWAVGVILYIIVTGKMPFDETKGTKSILEEQRQLDFCWSKALKLSAACQALVRRIFTWDFVARPTISAVLTDTWFKDVASSTPRNPCGTGDSSVTSQPVSKIVSAIKSSLGTKVSCATSSPSCQPSQRSMVENEHEGRTTSSSPDVILDSSIPCSSKARLRRDPTETE